jgi:hypothetical protein
MRPKSHPNQVHAQLGIANGTANGKIRSVPTDLGWVDFSGHL